jgi:hypothetical protein
MGIEHPVFNENYSEGMFALFLFSLESIRGHAQDLVFFAPPQVKAQAKEILDRPKGWLVKKSELVEAALRHMLDQRPQKPGELPELPSFAGGRPLVDIADREALYQAMEGR